MALRDLLPWFNSPPPNTAPALDEPVGGSGRYNTGGFLQWDELNRDLQGRQGILQFDKMHRTDADVRRALTLVVTPISGANMSIEPYGDAEDPATPLDEEIARFVAWNLLEHMRPRLPSHVHTALTVAGRSGFAPFEQVYEHTQWNGRDVLALKTLDLRLPRSVMRFLQDGPELVAIQQYAVPRPEGAPDGQVLIAAENLVYYRFGAEGDNWDGQSLLRPAYKHWKYKDGIELIEAIAIEKFAIGIPVAFPPQGASQGQLDDLEQALANIRANETQYLMAPGPKAEYAEKGNGWHIEILTPNESRAQGQEISDAKNYHSDKIASVVIAEFMRQGMKNVGAKATSETQQDPFLDFVESVSSLTVEDTLTEQLIRRLVDLNYDAKGRYPHLKIEVIDDTNLQELSTYVSTLANVGAIRVEPTLEAFLRQRADLPPADEDALDEIAQAKQEQAQQAADMLRKGMVTGPDGKPVPQPGATGPDKPAANTRAKTLDAAPRRALKPWETHMSLDRIEGAIDDARARFQAAPGDHARQLARDLAAQAVKGPVRHAEPPKALRDAIHTELQGLYTTGRATVTDELARQAQGRLMGDPNAITLAKPNGRRLGQLARRAHVIAQAVRAAIVTAVNKASVTRSADAASVQAAGEQAAAAALRAAAMENAAAALNAGRSDQADQSAQLIEGSRYTSILDGNTCDQCGQADDDVLRPLDDPVRLANEPPNPNCDGGERCRCMEAFQLAPGAEMG